MPLPIIAFGMIYNFLLLFAVCGWALEPSVADDTDDEPPADDASKGLAVSG